MSYHSSSTLRPQLTFFCFSAIVAFCKTSEVGRKLSYFTSYCFLRELTIAVLSRSKKSYRLIDFLFMVVLLLPRFFNLFVIAFILTMFIYRFYIFVSRICLLLFIWVSVNNSS